MNVPYISPSLETKQIDPRSDPDWERLAAQHPGFNLFYSVSWARVLCQTYHRTPLYLYYHRDRELAALLPLMEVCSSITGRRGVSLPSTDYCDPLVFGDCDPELLVRKFTTLAEERRWRYFEVRGFKALNSLATPSATFYGHSLDLSPDLEKLFSRFTSSNRRAIRKSEQSGLNVEITHSREAMLEFYRLHLLTRRRHGLPPQSLSFFLNIHQEIIQPKHGFIVLVSTESRTVSAGVFFHMGRKALYKFGASNERYQELRGNNLMMWEAIKFLAQEGVTNLHFGRTSVNHDGLRRFKLGWGSREETIQYFRFDIGNRTWTTSPDHGSGFHTKIFSRMPLAINRVMGTLIYPHLD